MRRYTVLGSCLVIGAGLLAGPAQADAAKPVFTVSSLIRNVGDTPVAVAVAPSHHRVYAVYGSSVEVRNTLNHARVATVPVGEGADAIAIDAKRHMVWVVNQIFGAATVIDEDTNAVVDTIHIAHSQGEQPVAIAIDTARHRAYVSNLDHTTVVLDTVQRQVVTTWPDVGSGGVAVDTARNVVLVEDQNAGTVIFVNATTGHVIKRLPVDSWPTGIAIDGPLDRAFTTNAEADTMSVVDLATRTLVRNVPTRSRPTGIAVDQTVGTVYVTNDFDGTDTMFRATSLVRLGTLTVGNGATEGAIDVAVDQSAHRAYALSEFDNTISVIDRTA